MSKLWHFDANQTIYRCYRGTVCNINFQCLVSIFDTGSLSSFKSKVIMVLFQLKSPNSERRNSSYVQNNSDYSMIKTEIRIWLPHGPTLSLFLSEFDQVFDNFYFYMDGSP